MPILRLLASNPLAALGARRGLTSRLAQLLAKNQ